MVQEPPLEQTILGREAERFQQVTGAEGRRRALLAGCVGNFVEWYDFALYGAFATIIAATFFPEADPVGGLLAAFAVFGVAFLARPAGALLFAHYGDRLGRRRALAVSILLMAVVTAAIGLLPGHDSVGWLAPVLLVLLPAGQGVAVGGEYGGSAAFVVEYAPADRRSWTAAGTRRPSGWAWPPGSPPPRCSPRPWTGRRCAVGDGGWRSCSPSLWGWSGSISGCGSRRRRASGRSNASARPPAPRWPTPCGPRGVRSSSASASSPRSPRRSTSSSSSSPATWRPPVAPRCLGRWGQRWSACCLPPVPRRWPDGSPTGRLADRSWSPVSLPSWCSPCR
jgi:MFS family permease